MKYSGHHYDLPVTAPEESNPNEPLSTLRGSSVQVDASAIRRVLMALTVVVLAVLTVTFVLVGVHKNAQINQLRDHGVPVNVKITGCLGLISGSGSNVSGYICRGNEEIDGHVYNEQIGGTTAFFKRGSTIRAVTVPGDPALLFTPDSVSSQHASANVFIVPIALFVVLIVFAPLAVRLQRRRRDASAT